MTSQRELMELAAKAVGYEYRISDLGNFQVRGSDMWASWNPRINDGDSLRLAIALRLDIGFDDDCQEVYVRQANDHFADAVTEPYGSDVASATRLAVLRMAAEIGQSMYGVDKTAKVG